jgi:hypothetical protein
MPGLSRVGFPLGRVQRTVSNVNRDHLAQLLDGPGYASSACRHALLDGADFIVWDGCTPASGMLPAYERREAHTVASGIPTLGFPEALASLRSLGTQQVQLGQVTVANPPYVFMLFFAADSSTVVACLGVDQVHQLDQVHQPDHVSG